MIKHILLIILMLTSSLFYAQEIEKKTLKDRITIGGYVKYMNTSSFVNLDSIITDNLIHNRIKIKANLSDNLSAVVEMRNRVFYGEATKLNPLLGSLLDHDMGQVDLSFVLLDKNSLVIHSILDRAYFKYISAKWEARIGRQRVNWGMNLAWNPNDLFNAYSLIDFDYQERPGVDAVRFQYFTGDLSSVDLAVQPGKDLDSSVIAGLWKFNKWKYDFQVLAGNYYSDIALGAGWAGNIKKSGFKGELTYFHPKKEFADTAGVLSASTTFDYSFKKGLYINASVLYNSGGSGSNSSGSFQSLIQEISAKSLMPSKLTYFSQVSGAFNPTLTGSFSAFYMQGVNMLLFMPSISYNIEENWDIMLVGQSAFGEVNNDFKGIGTGVYLRLMMSY